MIYTGDIGTKIQVNVGQDITNGNDFRIYYQSPSGVTGYWTATRIDDQTIEYSLLESDMNEAGYWTVQGFVALPGWSGFTEKRQIEVKQSIETS